ncbi:MAG: electron transport complex subunit RsxC [Thermodesulfovibrionales bacterium]
MALATFRRGGVHPPDKKELSAGAAITPAKAPGRVVIPLSQHIGAPCKATVSIGDEVSAGQVIGVAEAFVSAPVHASVSGKVTAIGEFTVAVGRMVPSVVIENDGKDRWVELKESPDYASLSADELKAKIREAGIVGMGGAAFPTAVKLSPPKEKPVDVVILNGAECEPYLTADYRLMLERPGDVIEGLKILMKVLGVKKGFVGIENNKPDAVEKMKAAASSEADIEVCALEVKYPQGAEKMLIKAITGREVPNKGGLPMDVGAVVQNIGTAVAIYEAVRFGRPLIERVVTVTGEGINRPSNLLVRVGTLVSELLEQCGGLKEEKSKVISGGPMMGFALASLDIPVTKGTSGILVLPDEIAHIEDYKPCIRCGRCVEACPMGLMPSMLSVLSEAGQYEETKEYNLFDCFECGSCTFVCPSKRPIVQFVRLAKSMVKP